MTSSGTTSYLFYSPQLDGMQVGSAVPPIKDNNSPQLQGSAMPNDLNLTPQFGPYLGTSHATSHHAQHQLTRDPRQPDVDISFLNSPLPGGMPEGQQHPFMSYMPVYTSPHYNPMGPAYSPMFGVPASPMMFGTLPHQEHFEPLPESWQKNDPARPPARGPARGPARSRGPPSRGMYGQMAQASRHYDGGRIAHFQGMGNNHGSHHNASGHGQYMNGPDLIPPASKSVLLDDLRGVSHPRAHTLADIVAEGLVADLATDQNGSRFIQTKLEEANDAEKQAVFEQILPETLRLCTDVFGNYCIQKFFEYGTPEQKLELSRKIKHRVLPLSLQMYGCRVVQKILESVDSDTQKALISELDGHVLECVKDQNANHVIQKCIEQVSSGENIDFIIKAFYGRVYDLSTHPYGCRVIQRMLEHCNPDLKYCDDKQNPVLEELMTYTEQLSKDQYGNYVLQHVLQHSSTECKDKIVEAVAKNILPFSKHKFASNVVERCFVATDNRQKEVLLDAVIGNSDSSPLVSMVRDQYGNYVIQKMLETLATSHRNKLIHKIAEYVPNIRKIAFGKHIVSKIEKLTGKSIDRYGGRTEENFI